MQQRAIRYHCRADPVAQLLLGVRRWLCRPIPVLRFWILVVGTMGNFALRITRLGRRVLATGGGETAASFSGIDTLAIKFKVLVPSSSAAVVAGMLYAGRLQSGCFQIGEGDELSVIAAAGLAGIIAAALPPAEYYQGVNQPAKSTPKIAAIMMANHTRP